VKTTIKKEGAVSVLYIANAKKNDSGPYICSLGNLTQNTIHVHVITGECFLDLAYDVIIIIRIQVHSFAGNNS
jgi:hypothetical protein